MSVIRQQNWLSQQRIDVSHLRSIDSGVAADVDVLAGAMLAGAPVVVRGFEVLASTGVGELATSLSVAVAQSLVIHPQASATGSLYQVPASTAPDILSSTSSIVDGSWVAGAVNYLGVDIVRAADSSTSDTVRFLDPVTETETSRLVPLARTLSHRYSISTAGFGARPTVLPLAIVTVAANGTVTSIQDARPMLYRLGSGGTIPDADHYYPWPQNRDEAVNDAALDTFRGGDKAITNGKAWGDAVMSRLWELGGGEHWYSATADRGLNLVWRPDSTTGIAPFSNGENFDWDGSDLHWARLRWIFDNSTSYFNDVADQTLDDPGLTDLAEGECLYVDLDRTRYRAAAHADNTVYALGDAVFSDTDKAYICTQAGTSATGPATPPTGTGTGIADGTCEWDYVGPGAAALTPVKASLLLLGTGSVPGSRQILAWRVGTQVYTRFWRYPVGTTFTPATTTSLGVVRLNATPEFSATPYVVAIQTNGTASVTATGGNAPGFTGTGNGSGAGVVGVGDTGPGLRGVPGSGGVGVDAGTGTVSNVGAPVAGNDAPTRDYVNHVAKNLVINSDFLFWQRNTTFAIADGNTTTYAADRWLVQPTNVDVSVARTVFGDTAPIRKYHRYGMRVERTAAYGGSEYVTVLQQLEQDMFQAILERKIKLQFWILGSSNFVSNGGTVDVTVTVHDGTSFNSGFANQVDSISDSVASVPVLGTHALKTFSSAAVVPYSVGGGGYASGAFLSFLIEYGGNDWVEIAGVSLIEGDSTLAFDSVHSHTLAGGTYAGELALCQRYFEKSHELFSFPAGSYPQYAGASISLATASGILVPGVRFLTRKRTASYSVTIYSPQTGASGNVRDLGAGIDKAVTVTAGTKGQNGFTIDEVTMTTGDAAEYQWSADDEIY